MIYLATFLILLFCILALGIGFIITKKPFKNHCVNKPREGCDCDDKTPPCENKVLY